MCSLGTRSKPGINSVYKKIDKNRTQELWQKLKLDTNVLVSDNLKPDLFNLIQEFSDMFTDEHVKVGNTSWVEFSIN